MNDVDQFYTLADVKYDYTAISSVKITQGSRTDFDVEGGSNDDTVYEVVELEVDLYSHHNYCDGSFDIEFSHSDGYYTVHVMYARRKSFSDPFETNSLRVDNRIGIGALYDLIMTIEDRMGALLPTLVYDAFTHCKEKMEAQEVYDQTYAKFTKEFTDAITAEIDKAIIADLVAMAGTTTSYG